MTKKKKIILTPKKKKKILRPFKIIAFPTGSAGKEFVCNAGDTGNTGSIPGSEDPLKEEWQPTPVFLLGKPQGLGSLAGYNPMARKESDTIERLSTAHQICRKLIQFSSPIDAT